MIKQFLTFFAIFLFIGSPDCSAQYSRYIIQLKNKTGSPYSVSNPGAFLSQRAIDRRSRANIAIDQQDLPINPAYIDSIRLAGTVTIINSSKWFNQVCIRTSDAAALARINNFSFVSSTTGIAARTTAVPVKYDETIMPAAAASARAPQAGDYYDYGLAYAQIHLHNTEFLHNHGFRGEGMQLAITDGGFLNYLTLPTFDSVRTNNQILGTWDFVAGNASVNEDNAHGMNCFSTIAANLPGSFVGSAPKTAFYLFRTEDVSSEYPIEEQNWAVAAERADSLGVDVISVSLGYNLFSDAAFDFTYDDMDGNTTLIARAADVAAKKGMAVVAAAGNDGNAAWHFIATPADADSILAVGAVGTNRVVAGFSGYGPSSDGQVKPDVAAVGSNAVVANQTTGQPGYGSGTSFACPIIAGVLTCLWQAFPEVNNMDIIAALRRSADRFVNPDNRSGYGIPDVKKAFVSLIQQLHQQQFSFTNCTANFNWTVKAAADMELTIERKLPSDTAYVSIATQNFTGGFSNRIFAFANVLSDYTAGVDIQYRLKMTIASDTSFYLDSATVQFVTSCSTVTERTVCPGGSTYLSAEVLPQYNYKWQVDNGSGFTDLTGNAIYSGVSTNTLILHNIPTSYYGYRYRYIATNGNSTITGNPITLKLGVTWTGIQNQDWFNTGNWSCGIVPTQFMDVLIKNGVPNFPVITNAGAVCHRLIVKPLAAVNVGSGYQLQVTGQ